jgi:RNA polymerase sigma-70 factor (ECF subfamily)
MEQDPATGATSNNRKHDPDAMSGIVVELISAVARDRDKTAFATLFGYYAPRVKSYLRGLRVDERQAEDLAQDVMLAVWRKAALYDPSKAAPGTWIFTIARNRFIDAVRRDNRPELDPDDPTLAPDAPIAADDDLASQEISLRVRRALSCLPPDQAQVVTLSFLEGLAHSAIAEELGVPLGTVKSRLRLAFGRLRGVLGDLR